jgi:T3SS negative regulator,GrlR
MACENRNEYYHPTGWPVLPNGLYAVQTKALDGRDVSAKGIVILRDGVLMGGDSVFYYTGTYACKDGRIKGEHIQRQHSPHVGKPLLFGGREVGFGFSGTYEGGSAELYGTALVGNMSVSLHIKAKKLADL